MKPARPGSGFTAALIRRIVKPFSFLILAAVIYGCDTDSPGTVVQSADDYKTYAFIKTQYGIIRTDPLLIASEIENLKKGQRVLITERTAAGQRPKDAYGFWYKVRTDDGITGWIYGETLSWDESDYNPNAGIVSKEDIPETLNGRWWEMEKDGGTGYRQLIFSEPDRYLLTYSGRGVSGGKFVIEENGTVKLEPVSQVGDSIQFSLVGEEIRIRTEYQGTVYIFRKVISEELQEQAEKGIEAGNQ